MWVLLTAQMRAVDSFYNGDINQIEYRITVNKLIYI